MIYFDNAATSWPKPPGVVGAVVDFLERVGANPGRSGHRLSAEAARIVHGAREAMAELAGMCDPLRVVFGANATEALNLALLGYLRSGDHVITSSMEHNSVMRPLRALEAGEGGAAIRLTVVRCSPEGCLDPARVEAALRPETALIVLTHASNVCGTLLPIRQVGAVARQAGALFLVDAAQTAGAVPIDMEADGIDLLAFTGHKALGGPTGTGGLMIGPRVDLTRLMPRKRGGTGSRSEEEKQPDFLPDRYESGTANAAGLAGLAAGVRWALERGVQAIRDEEAALVQRLIDGLCAVPGVIVYGPHDSSRQAATVAFAISGLDHGEVGLRLDEEFGILCRAGLHCAPAAHHTLGTFPGGTLRFSLGALNTRHQVDEALGAVRDIASGSTSIPPSRRQ